MHLLCLQSSQDILISFGVRIVFPFSLMEMGGASGQKKKCGVRKKNAYITSYVHKLLLGQTLLIYALSQSLSIRWLLGVDMKKRSTCYTCLENMFLVQMLKVIYSFGPSKEQSQTVSRLEAYHWETSLPHPVSCILILI